ncbi:MAG: asparagine synthase (glutamine-hydrolyzing) [Nitrospinaceae bacterium]|nr:asparagine synthase (glutamine-hydrolyzing) [Nitrospinaceae bacterium]
MCGIAGLLDFDENGQPGNSGKILRLMLDRIRHRGPDDRGEELISSENGPTLHLGHQRFSIIDLSPGGHQPMANDDQSLWLSTNSEIYNFRELREELSDQFRFNSQSDTEVLLKSYEHWGIDCLEKLRGMFAFAIWDSKKRQLILARDRLGIKPLYYIASEKQFLFASEVRALLASGLSDSEINPTGLYHYLSFGHLKSPDTLIGNIQELKAGHYLVVDCDGNVKETQYWHPLDSVNSIELDSTDSIQSLLCDAIKYRQVSDVPIGAFLSGGIDSSAIVSHMASISDEPITTLTIGFKEKEFDESEYSAEISHLFNTKHQLLTLDEEQLLESLPAAIGAMDQPTMDGINTFLISRAAHEAGLKVVLSGLGGDELFGGYPSFQLVPKLLEKNKWLKLYPKFLLDLGTKLLKYSLSSDQSIKLDHWLNEKLSGAHEYYLIRALYCQDQVSELFQDQNLANKEILKNFKTTNSALENLSRAEVNDDFSLISYLETTHYLQNMLLRDTDMMSMAHPLEVRVPFMDHKLVEHMFSMPARLKKLTATPKALLVDSMKPPLPDSIVHRKKMGFTLPFDPWMRGAMKPEMESVLLTSVKPLENLISQAATEKIWQQFLAGKISWSRPWALYVLKRWVDKNLS